MGQLQRALKIIRHLQLMGGSRFGELHSVMAPLSKTTLSRLLGELADAGEVAREGRFYHACFGAMGQHHLSASALPPDLLSSTQAVLRRTADEVGHSCALFARVGRTTMRIVDRHNLEGAHWQFAEVGREWPFVPFHGFAKVFLAHSDDPLALQCYRDWTRYLQPDLVPDSEEIYVRQLAGVRAKGYALEYREESMSLLRIAVPVWIGGGERPSYAFGCAARSVYLLEVDRCLPVILQGAVALGRLLDNGHGQPVLKTPL